MCLASHYHSELPLITVIVDFETVQQVCVVEVVFMVNASHLTCVPVMEAGMVRDVMKVTKRVLFSVNNVYGVLCVLYSCLLSGMCQW